MRRVLIVTFAALAFCGINAPLLAQEQPVPSGTAPIATPASPEQPTAGPDEKEKLPPKGVIHLQEVKDPPKLHADQPCNNYSWAASLAAVLESQKADIAEDYWIDKYYGGDLCLENMGTPDDLIKKAEGEYVLDDGRHVELKLEYFAGLPANSSTLLVPIMTDEILILFVDGHADLLIGAMWDEYQSKRGERMIDLKELHLLDPLLDGEKQKVVLDTTGDDVSKVTGFMKVTATEVHQQYWPK
jgi:hypothetical protein